MDPTASMIDMSLWPGMLEEIRKRRPTLYGQLCHAEVLLLGGVWVVSVETRFDLATLGSAETVAYMTDLFEDLTGRRRLVLVEITPVSRDNAS